MEAGDAGAANPEDGVVKVPTDRIAGSSPDSVPNEGQAKLVGPREDEKSVVEPSPWTIACLSPSSSSSQLAEEAEGRRIEESAAEAPKATAAPLPPPMAAACSREAEDRGQQLPEDEAPEGPPRVESVFSFDGVGGPSEVDGRGHLEEVPAKPPLDGRTFSFEAIGFPSEADSRGRPEEAPQMLPPEGRRHSLEAAEALAAAGGARDPPRAAQGWEQAPRDSFEQVPQSLPQEGCRHSFETVEELAAAGSARDPPRALHGREQVPRDSFEQVPQLLPPEGCRHSFEMVEELAAAGSARDPPRAVHGSEQAPRDSFDFLPQLLPPEGCRHSFEPAEGSARDPPEAQLELTLAELLDRSSFVANGERLSFGGPMEQEPPGAPAQLLSAAAAAAPAPPRPGEAVQGSAPDAEGDYPLEKSSSSTSEPFLVWGAEEPAADKAAAPSRRHAWSFDEESKEFVQEMLSNLVTTDAPEESRRENVPAPATDPPPDPESEEEEEEPKQLPVVDDPAWLASQEAARVEPILSTIQPEEAEEEESDQEVAEEEGDANYPSFAAGGRLFTQLHLSMARDEEDDEDDHRNALTGGVLSPTPRPRPVPVPAVPPAAWPPPLPRMADEWDNLRDPYPSFARYAPYRPPAEPAREPSMASSSSRPPAPPGSHIDRSHSSASAAPGRTITGDDSVFSSNSIFTANSLFTASDTEEEANDGDDTGSNSDNDEEGPPAPPAAVQFFRNVTDTLRDGLGRGLLGADLVAATIGAAPPAYAPPMLPAPHPRDAERQDAFFADLERNANHGRPPRTPGGLGALAPPPQAFGRPSTQHLLLEDHHQRGRRPEDELGDPFTAHFGPPLALPPPALRMPAQPFRGLGAVQLQHAGLSPHAHSLAILVGEMGFRYEEAMEALEASSGDLELALERLFGGGNSVDFELALVEARWRQARQAQLLAQLEQQQPPAPAPHPLRRPPLPPGARPRRPQQQQRGHAQVPPQQLGLERMPPGGFLNIHPEPAEDRERSQEDRGQEGSVPEQQRPTAAQIALAARAAMMAAAAAAAAATPRKEESGKKDEKSNGKTYTCGVCYVDYPRHEIAGTKCWREHPFCCGCTKMHITTKINSSNVESLVCMADRCNNPIKPKVLKAVLSKEEHEKLLWFRKRAKLSRDPRIRWCPTPNCSGYMRGAPWRTKLSCPQCKVALCYKCNRPWHPGMPCMGTLEDQFHEWARGHGVQPCPRCGVPIVKSEGCNHMTCPSCRYEWCWICRERYTADHYAGWNVNGCAGWQFRNLSDEQMQKRMKELHDSSLMTLFLQQLRSNLNELLYGACLPCGLATCGMRWLLGPNLGLSGGDSEATLQAPVNQRRVRLSARTYRDGLLTFLLFFVLQGPIGVIMIVAALLFMPGMLLLRDRWNPKSRHPIKVGCALLALAIPGLLSYPVGLVCALLFGPAASLLEHHRVTCKWLRRTIFFTAVLLTPLVYAVAVVAFAVAVIGVILVGPGMTIFDSVENTEFYQGMRSRGGKGRALAMKMALIAGGALGTPFVYLGCVLVGIMVIWTFLQFMLFFTPLVLTFWLSLKDEWFIGAARFHGSVPDPVIAVVFTLSMVLPLAPLAPGRLLVTACCALRNGCLERIASLSVFVASAAVLWQVSRPWTPFSSRITLISAGVAALLVSALLAIRLAVHYNEALNSEGTAALGGVKPPLVLVWLSLLPCCLLFLPLGIVCSVMWLVSEGDDPDFSVSRCWLAHWASLIFTPSETLLNVICSPSCAISGRLLQAGYDANIARVALWATLPLSPVLWALAFLLWLPPALLSTIVHVARKFGPRRIFRTVTLHLEHMRLEAELAQAAEAEAEMAAAAIAAALAQERAQQGDGADGAPPPPDGARRQVLPANGVLPNAGGNGQRRRNGGGGGGNRGGGGARQGGMVRPGGAAPQGAVAAQPRAAAAQPRVAAAAAQPRAAGGAAAQPRVAAAAGAVPQPRAAPAPAQPRLAAIAAIAQPRVAQPQVAQPQVVQLQVAQPQVVQPQRAAQPAVAVVAAPANPVALAALAHPAAVVAAQD